MRRPDLSLISAISFSLAATSLDAISNLEASSSAVSSDTPVMAASGATRGGSVALTGYPPQS